MNLYKIEFQHIAPKGSANGLKCLLLAETDEQVYDWIASEPEVNDKTLYNSWKDNESVNYNIDTEEFEDIDGDCVSGWYDEESNPEAFKTRMLRLNGEINDDDIDFSDSYYGITVHGWTLLKENVKTDYSELIELGIVYKSNDTDNVQILEF